MTCGQAFPAHLSCKAASLAGLLALAACSGAAGAASGPVRNGRPGPEAAPSRAGSDAGTPSGGAAPARKPSKVEPLDHDVVVPPAP
ncbi:MAG: hypothetical protein HY744_12345 [Deltaproteobacteria bacterium]|nr:hypothetical protein [Deltaproteobacteria bacterium]